MLIARLMLEPADLLLLDEPTNDLDIPTLEVLEESLLEFPGALVLVTHDRYLLDRVSTQLLALDGRGGRRLLRGLRPVGAGPASGGGDHSASREPARRRRGPAPRPGPSAWATASSRNGNRWRRASWRRSSASKPARRRWATPRSPQTTRRLRERLAALTAAQGAVEQLYARWAELEAKLKG